MGSLVVAKCKCGVEAYARVGGGRKNYTTTCYFPCLCDSCHNIVQMNLLAKNSRCPKCRAANPIPYDDPRLVGSAGEKEAAGWYMKELIGRALILTDGSYRCPKCEKMTLRFAKGGRDWD